MTIATTKSTESKKQQTTAAAGTEGAETVVLPDAGPAYGIRSHLHEFYDWRGPFDTSEGGDAWFLLPPSSSSTNRRRLIYIFRALTILGLLLLVSGAVLILIGYMWPRDSPASIFQQLKKETEDGKYYYISADDTLNLLEVRILRGQA